jgi:hypothetical protein
MAKGTKSIENSSGMSKRADPKKRNPAPIAGTGFMATMQKVSGAGRSKPGAPTKNARKVQPKPVEGTGFEITMMGKGKRK